MTPPGPAPSCLSPPTEQRSTSGGGASARGSAPLRPPHCEQPSLGGPMGVLGALWGLRGGLGSPGGVLEVLRCSWGAVWRSCAAPGGSYVGYGGLIESLGGPEGISGGSGVSKGSFGGAMGVLGLLWGCMEVLGALGGSMGVLGVCMGVLWGLCRVLCGYRGGLLGLCWWSWGALWDPMGVWWPCGVCGGLLGFFGGFCGFCGATWGPMGVRLGTESLFSALPFRRPRGGH